MKLKKFLAGVGTLCLALILFLPLQVHAQESAGSTSITTKVPDKHTVLLDIGEHGSVLVNGKTYTHADKEVQIARLAKQKYIIQAEDGWQIESVRYGKADAQEIVKLADNAFTAPAINSNDNKLTVTLKQLSGGTTQDKGGNIGTGVQTGDTTNVMLWSLLALLSCFGVAGTLFIKHREENR